ncbi:hypothetical protein C5B42_00490 [Candidatus Cerribacteria bacterium 'Amazon FNV 2010 28 9']|uniref:BioF2-like acetyltransferase domain-containing protein n=1 Tax=Candidatus Cerribacteria bacterium 'Amazon FNV 2010 28 9' TaxID=2081795 RepID=A0A317JRI4_9BACT|nr:MAG: hypothetical protein C5B42_00490 [Candidatus Cerribacteria bacterium 'Amazon FNV 2010 28 9']
MLLEEVKKDLVERYAQRRDYHQAVAYAKVMEDINWRVLPVGESFLFEKLIGPFAIGKLQHPHVIELARIEEIRRRSRCTQLFIEPGINSIYIDKGKKVEEPESLLKQLGYKETKTHHTYTKSFLIDLDKDESALIASFSQAVRRTLQRGHTTEYTFSSIPLNEVNLSTQEQFFTLYREWGKEKNVFGYPDAFMKSIMKHFGNTGFLCCAWKEKMLEAVILLLCVNRVSYYFNAFSSREAREEGIPTKLAIESMKIAKQSGCDIYDFCSCFDERYPNENPRWKGFSEFKQRFHPTAVYYPVCYQKTSL